MLNTKPVSRLEAARIVARAFETTRRDETGVYNTRTDLEPVLSRLTDALRPEQPMADVTDLNEKVVFVTGGTGSFGRKFTEVVLQEFRPRKLIIFITPSRPSRRT